MKILRVALCLVLVISVEALDCKFGNMFENCKAFLQDKLDEQIINLDEGLRKGFDVKMAKEDPSYSVRDRYSSAGECSMDSIRQMAKQMPRGSDLFSYVPARELYENCRSFLRQKIQDEVRRIDMYDRDILDSFVNQMDDEMDETRDSLRALAKTVLSQNKFKKGTPLNKITGIYRITTGLLEQSAGVLKSMVEPYDVFFGNPSINRTPAKFRTNLLHATDKLTFGWVSLARSMRHYDYDIYEVERPIKMEIQEMVEAREQNPLQNLVAGIFSRKDGFQV